jgi:signal transduction histidine kinase/HAMP domain-containing protein
VLRDRSLGMTVALGFASLLVMMAALIALAIIEVDVTERQRQTLAGELLMAETANELAISVARADASLRSFILTRSPSELQAARNFREEARQRVTELLSYSTSDEEIQPRAQQLIIAANLFQYQASTTEAYALSPRPDVALAFEQQRLSRTVEGAQSAAQLLSRRLTDRATAVRRQLAHRGDRLTRNLVIGFGLAGLIGILLGVHFVRLITEPVGRLVAAARALQAGDYSLARRLGGQDGSHIEGLECAEQPAANEISTLARAFTGMATALEEREQQLRAQAAHLESTNLQLVALQSVTDAALSDLGLESLLEQLLERIVAGLGGSAGAIFLAAPESGRLQPRAVLSIPEEWTRGELLSLASQFAQAVAVSDRGLEVPDLGSEPAHAYPYLARRGVSAVLALPLRQHGQVVGIAHVDFLEAHPFCPSQRQLVHVFAERLERAIERARSLAALESWGHELERRVEDQQQRLLLSERLAAIGLVGGNIAHELRNPLGVISNSVYFLRRRGTSFDEKTCRHLEIMEAEVAHATRIITNLVDFSNAIEPVTTRLNLNTIIQAALQRAHLPAEIDLVLELDPNLPDVAGDESQLAQVMDHLIRNAVQAMNGMGRLRFGTVADQGWVRVAVQDSGPGVPAADESRIFEPLFTTRVKGMGLGLALARKIVRAHGGEVLLSSEPGHGACFTIELPVTDSLRVRERESEERVAAASVRRWPEDHASAAGQHEARRPSPD